MTDAMSAPPVARAADGSVVMRAIDISKAFGGVQALKSVNFDIRAGRVTVLFGENGAGKSTLMKILCGVQPPTSGTIELDGEPVRFANTVDAAERGVAIIHQELNLCPNLSIRDNVFLAREMVKGPFVDYTAQDAEVNRLLSRLEEEIPPQTLVANLRLGQQQVVEIARALAGEARVLIMDEPTSALSASEVEVLFGVIRELRAAGVAIVYISHHLEEALEICDHAVVFRDGELVAVADREEIDINWVIGKMVGRDFSDLAPDLPHQAGAPVLEIQDVLVADPANPSRLAVNGFSLTVHAGEIVALYGLMGAGRTELLEALAGRRPVAAGRVLLNGSNVAKLTVRERIGAGIALVPEDRQRDGLAQNLSVASNMSLASITRFVRFSLIQRVRERARVGELITNLRVKAASPDAPVTSLSGGNQQKVVIGKVMMTDPKVLLLDEPTRGIDVGAKAEIFQLMADGAKSGLAVLFATSEVNEALLSANRVIVVSKGRIVREFDPAVATKEDLMIASGESESTPGEPADSR